jgi:hypothetical protein
MNKLTFLKLKFNKLIGALVVGSLFAISANAAGPTYSPSTGIEINANTSNIETNANSIATNASGIAANSNSIASSDFGIRKNSSNIDENRRGIAMVASLQHTTVLPGMTNALDVAAAHFDGETGMSVNYARRINENWQVNLGAASTTDFDESVIKAGVGVQW